MSLRTQAAKPSPLCRWKNAYEQRFINSRRCFHDRRGPESRAAWLWRDALDRTAGQLGVHFPIRRRAAACCGELRVNFIDTAISYGPVFREIIAAALHPYPKGLVIAAKGGLAQDRTRPDPERWRPQEP